MGAWAACSPTPRQRDRAHLPVHAAGSVQLPRVRNTGKGWGRGAGSTCGEARRRLQNGAAAVACQEIGMQGMDAASQKQVASRSSLHPPE